MISIVLGHLGNASINRVVFTYHLPIFFLVTGYFTHSSTPIWKGVKRRFRTLIVPYIVSCFAILISSIIHIFIYDHQNGLKDTVHRWFLAAIYGAGDSYQEPFVIYGIGAIWFLLATFWGSILLMCVIRCNAYVRVILVFLCFSIGYWTRVKLFWFPLSIQAGFCCLLFMYIGYIIHEENLAEKICEKKELFFFVLIFSALLWFQFMRTFQSFWLVHNDFGRGFSDIIASLGGSFVLVVLSMLIDKYAIGLNKVLACLGKYSVIFLSVHIIELNTFRWWYPFVKYFGEDFWNKNWLCLLIICKLSFCIIMTILLSRFKIIRRIYMGP